jgi:hypothetical protein
MAITNTRDPYEQFAEDRRFAYGRGEQLTGDISGFEGGEDSWRQDWRNKGINAYDPILNGSGAGYTQQEQDRIYNDPSGLPITQDRINDLYLTEDDTRNIYQNPYDARQFVRPDYQNAVNDSGISRQREAYGSQADAMRGTIDPSRLRLSESYGGEQGSILDGSDAGVRGAIGGIDSGNLRQDSGFADRYRMQDRDVQDYQDRAARNVQNQKQSALDEIEQRAVQSGTTSPLAMGALRDRYEMGAQVNSADAALDARLGAKNAQAQRELNIETNRQDAEGRYADNNLRKAGLQADTEMSMGDRRLGALENREGMRLQSEQGLTDRRLGAEQTIGDRRLQTEANINNSNLDLAKYQQDSGANIWQQTDKTASDRYAQLAANRQDVGRWGEENRFDQGFAVNNAQTQRAGAIADGRRADQQEARGWLTHQQDSASDNVNRGQDRRISLYGQQNDAMQNATGRNAQYDLQRRGMAFGTQFKGAFGSALGKGLGEGMSGGWFKQKGED